MVIDMIFEIFCDAFYKIVTALLGWVNLPSFPEDHIYDVYELLSSAITSGAGLLFFFCDRTVIKICLSLSLAMVSAEFLYFVVMWILKKIPMLSIK